jgi:hypothetical protein
MDIRLFWEGATGLNAYLFMIVEESMREGRGDRRKRETVGDGKRGRKEERAVSLICLEVERGISINNPADIVPLPPVVERVWGHHGQVTAIPNVGVLCVRSELENWRKEGIGTNIDDRDEEPEKQHDSGADVGSSPPWDRKGWADVGKITPVEGEDTHGHAVRDAKHLVDLGIVGSDPADPRKGWEGRKKVSGQKVWDETDYKESKVMRVEKDNWL